MPRLHPSITRRLHAICKGAMTLPEDVRFEVLEYVTEQAVRVEAARAALREHQPRILGEVAGYVEEKAAAGRMPLAASLVGLGWVMSAIVQAWLSGHFYTLISTYFQYQA